MLTKLKWSSTSSALLSPEQANFTSRGPVGSERSDPTDPAKPSYTLEQLAQELMQLKQGEQAMERRLQQVEEQVQQVRQDSSYTAMATTSRYEKGRFVLEPAAAGQPDDELVGKQSGAAWDSNSSWDDCRLKELPEATRDGNPSVQHYFDQDPWEERLSSFLRPWLPAYLAEQPFKAQLVYFQLFAAIIYFALVVVWGMAVLVSRSHQGN